MGVSIQLGLHNGIEAGAALLVGDELVGAASEERFTREKMASGPPMHAISYLLAQAGISWKDVDEVVYPLFSDVGPPSDVVPELMRRVCDGVAKQPSLAGKYVERVESELRLYEQQLSELVLFLAEVGLKDRLKMVDHHLSHACAGFFTSGYPEAICLTADGKGSYKSSATWDCTTSEVKLRDCRSTFDSLGYLYGTVTQALGLQAHRHEGKVTGLAAFGKECGFRKLLGDMVSLSAGRPRCELGPYYLPWFCGERDLPDLYAEICQWAPEDVAHDLQAAIEEIICGWVQTCFNEVGSDCGNLVLSGGLFANVKLNQRIQELECVRGVFVCPFMGDGGLPLGGLLANRLLSGSPLRLDLHDLGLGPVFEDHELTSCASKLGLNFRHTSNVIGETIDLIQAGLVVGLFRGRMEYGPRALGKRSILYHGRDSRVNDWLNRRLSRTEYMPFAPVIASELASQSLVGWNESHYSSRFMTMTYGCTPEFIKSCPACVHVDGSARPQVVFEDVDPFLHALLMQFHQKTGDLALINTSFNNHEEPIVCSPDDALAALMRGNVDAIVSETRVVIR